MWMDSLVIKENPVHRTVHNHRWPLWCVDSRCKQKQRHRNGNRGGDVHRKSSFLHASASPKTILKLSFDRRETRASNLCTAWKLGVFQQKELFGALYMHKKGTYKQQTTPHLSECCFIFAWSSDACSKKNLDIHTYIMRPIYPNISLLTATPSIFCHHHTGSWNRRKTHHSEAQKEVLHPG